MQWKKVRSKHELSAKDKLEAGLFIKKYNQEIIAKWQQVFILHQKVKCEKISRRISK
jgi:hypothetical protein